MERGYVKFWRMSEDSEVFASSDLWRLWSWCLFRANFKKRFVPFKTGKGEITVKLEPGQFIFGRSKAAESLGWSSSTVWKRMKKLESIGNIAIESNRQYSVVSICNWEQYQDSFVEKVTGNEQASDRQVTGKEQPSNTDKKDKNDKKVKKFIKPTIDEVSIYCSERKNNVDPERFVDYYQANGWMAGKNKMKDWKAAVRTWEKNGFNSGGKSEWQ